MHLTDYGLSIVVFRQYDHYSCVCSKTNYEKILKDGFDAMSIKMNNRLVFKQFSRCFEQKTYFVWYPVPGHKHSISGCSRRLVSWEQLCEGLLKRLEHDRFGPRNLSEALR